MPNINVFAPTKPHAKQLEVLDDPARFKILRAGRKFRKTSLMISWLFENALTTPKLTFPYIAPNREQAKSIAWDDHVERIRAELEKKHVPHKVNESELSIEFPHGGKVRLFGVENREALRGISNWGAIACDEYDDWKDDIWSKIIRPNLMTHKAPAIIGGTPKGFRNMYRLSLDPTFKEFHYTSFDNPDLDRQELADLAQEYGDKGEDAYNQEILAEYVKPTGTVYKEWKMEHYESIDYDPDLPLHITFDWGINDPTSVIWIQPSGSETRVIDYYEASSASIEHFISVIQAKPYKQADLYTGDPAGKARTLTTGTSVIEILAKKGMFIRSKDGVKIPDQIRATHVKVPGLYINSDKCDRFRECILNYRYPEKPSTVINQENELPIHDEFSHAMRAFEYWAVNVGGTLTTPEYRQSSRPKLAYGSRMR